MTPELQSGQEPAEDGEQADELPWDGFWHFVQKLFSCPNPVSSAVWMAGLKWSHRWRSQMWRSWADMVCSCNFKRNKLFVCIYNFCQKIGHTYSFKDFTSFFYMFYIVDIKTMK
jgi:hypothetical protein